MSFGETEIVMSHRFAVLRGRRAGRDRVRLLNLLVLLLTLVPVLVWVGIAVSVKRLHDMGLSGWWVILCFIPFLHYVAVPVLGVIRGKVGANVYGEDPQRVRVPAR